MKKKQLHDPVTPNTIRRAQRDTRPCVFPAGSAVSHGSEAGYNLGCRCDACTDAVAMRARRHAAIERGDLQPEPRVLAGRTHGTISAYNAGRCRCDDCRAAARDHRAKMRANARRRDPARVGQNVEPCIFCGDLILWGITGGGHAVHEAACSRRWGAA